MEQRHQEELSVLKEKNTEQQHKLDQQDAIMKQLMQNQVAESRPDDDTSQQELKQKLSTLEAAKEAQASALKAEHASLVQQLTKEKEEVETQLKEAQAAKQTTTDSHETKVKVLTEQIEKLQADLNTANSTNQSVSADQHEPVIKMLRDQKKDLQADLKEVQEKLVSANLQVVEAEEKLEDVEQKLRQTEQRDRRTAKTVRVLSASAQYSSSIILHPSTCFKVSQRILAFALILSDLAPLPFHQ